MSVSEDGLVFPFEQHRLSNGLRVLLHADDALPITAVNVWYHVGSKDEPADRTGLAHLFEHLMFEGSAGYDDDFFRPLQEAGGSVNGSTSQDRTNYYEVVPSEFLELALWLEADRMSRLLPALSQAKLDNQRQIVKNERRQRVDNQPYGRVGEIIGSLAFSPEHPYSWPVIGWMEHLDAIDLGDAQRFFNEHYHPGNASLVVAGRFDRGKTLRWIEEYFGAAPGGGPTPLPTVPADARGVRRQRVEDSVALARLDMIHPTGPRFHRDEPALDFAAEILGGRSKNSRLNRRLIRQDRLAVSAAASNGTQRLAGQFAIRAYALAGVGLDAIEAAIYEETGRLRAEPPSVEEMDRVRNGLRLSAFSRMETLLGRAETLQHFLFFRGDVAADSVREELQRYDAVTAEQVSAALTKYLPGDDRDATGRVVLEVVPAASRNGASPPAANGTASTFVRPPASSAHLPGAGVVFPFSMPVVQRAVASNGLRVAVVRQAHLPRVDCQLIFDAGAVCESGEALGAARLTADMLDEGTLLRDGVQLAGELDQLGASLSINAGLESMTLSMRCLRSCLPAAFALLAESASLPLFAEADFTRERGRLGAELAHRARQPATIADEALAAAVFGADHPYGRPSDGTATSIERLTPTDLAAFHQRHCIPTNAWLIVVGEARLDEIVNLVEKSFGGWRGEPAPAPLFPTSPERGSPFTLIERNEAAQSVVRVGQRCVHRSSPDYLPLILLNTVLGGQFMSRLNANLREEKGLTYGARSALIARRRGGVFLAETDVDAAATEVVVREVLREAREAVRGRPISVEEVAFAKAYLIRRFPARFETASSVAAHIAQLAIYNLPYDYYDGYVSRLSAITADEVHRAAEKHLSLDAWRVVVVGPPGPLQSLKRGML